MALIGDRYKLVHNLGAQRPKSDNGTTKISDYELYDILNDESESENIAGKHPEIVERMKNVITSYSIHYTKLYEATI